MTDMDITAAFEIISIEDAPIVEVIPHRAIARLSGALKRVAKVCAEFATAFMAFVQKMADAVRAAVPFQLTTQRRRHRVLVGKSTYERNVARAQHRARQMARQTRRQVTRMIDSMPDASESELLDFWKRTMKNTRPGLRAFI